MAHDHSHPHPHSHGTSRETERRALKQALALILVFMLAEVTAGVLATSVMNVGTQMAPPMASLHPGGMERRCFMASSGVSYARSEIRILSSGAG